MIWLDCDLVLPQAVAGAAASAAKALIRLSPAPAGNTAWREYHGRFLSRYGPDTPVAVDSSPTPPAASASATCPSAPPPALSAWPGGAGTSTVISRTASTTSMRVIAARCAALTSSAETSAGCMTHFASILAARATSRSSGGSASRALPGGAAKYERASLWCPGRVSWETPPDIPAQVSPPKALCATPVRHCRGTHETP
ncbi:lantibiotic dehydratase [Streptomyces europaeiscabiei]|uniref:lantibiotic dehydratase n=1 Tax=Streptomyces europaeiscabiei TaxID=146819 RepID=UPI0039909230